MEILQQIQGLGKPMHFAEGDKIYSDDYSVTEPCIYLVLSGNVTILKRYTPLQKDSFLLGPGEIFGMIEVYTGTHRLTDAIAQTRLEVLAFSKVEFEKAMVSSIQFALGTIRILSKILRQVNDKIRKLE